MLELSCLLLAASQAALNPDAGTPMIALGAATQAAIYFKSIQPTPSDRPFFRYYSSPWNERLKEIYSQQHGPPRPLGVQP